MEKAERHVFNGRVRINNQQVDREVRRIRRLFGIEQLKTGDRRCLRCETKFFSDNLKTNKLCTYCRTLR